MSVHVMKEGFIGISGEAGKTAETESVPRFEEWNQTAGAWPLKRLVAIWNDLPGVTPVQKFTSREIALRRIWQAVHAPEGVKTRDGKEQSRVPFREEHTQLSRREYNVYSQHDNLNNREVSCNSEQQTRFLPSTPERHRGSVAKV